MCQLVVKNFSPGLFSCKAENKAGQDEIKATVSIKPIPRKKSLKKSLEAPKFIEKFNDVEAEPGDQIELVAKVIGNPIPEVTWSKDGVKLSDSPETAISFHDGVCKLIFNNVSDDIGGRISCKAVNSEGQDEIVATVTVKSSQVDGLQEPLKLDEGLPEAVKCQQGEPIRLQFKVSGPLEHTVKWLKDGKPVEEDRRHHIELGDDGEVTMVVDEAMPKDSGNYQVLVQTPNQELRSDCQVSVSRKYQMIWFRSDFTTKNLMFIADCFSSKRDEESQSRSTIPRRSFTDKGRRGQAVKT